MTKYNVRADETCLRPFPRRLIDDENRVRIKDKADRGRQKTNNKQQTTKGRVQTVMCAYQNQIIKNITEYSCKPRRSRGEILNCVAFFTLLLFRRPRAGLNE